MAYLFTLCCCACVLSLTDPLRSIDLALSATVFSIYIPPILHTNKDTLLHSISLYITLHTAGLCARPANRR